VLKKSLLTSVTSIKDVSKFTVNAAPRISVESSTLIFTSKLELGAVGPSIDKVTAEVAEVAKTINKEMIDTIIFLYIFTLLIK